MTLRSTLSIMAACFGLALLASESQAVSLGQVDDFSGALTQGWQVGSSDEQPRVVPTGGPSGADAYLAYDAQGGGGPTSRVIIYNLDQWTGDYLAAGVTGVTMDLLNTGSEPLTMRLAIGSQRSAMSGDWYASTQGVAISPGDGWTRAYFPLDEASLTDLTGTVTYEALLSNVGALRVLSSSSPSNIGELQRAGFGMDNVRAVPEPAAAAFTLLALLAACRTRRG